MCDRLKLEERGRLMAAPYCCKCAESASQSAKKHLADLLASCPPIFQFYTARLPCHVMICCPLCQCGCVCRLTRGGGRSTSSSGLSSLSLCAWQPVSAPPLYPLAAWGWTTALTCCWSPSRSVPSRCWASSWKTMPRRGFPQPEGAPLIHPRA